ncbi:MAG: hypothetical protein HY803_09155 [candidate division NC10 bacterium]|nr:hypothetical protein [candidate division NC10 bacterium]
MFERAVIEPDPGRRRRLLSFVLVGAGCTGVELATELLDLARKTLVRHYRGLDPREVRIVLAEGTGRIWTAGVRATPVVEALPVEWDKLGRAVVDETLVLPPTAQVAVQQARSVAGNIARLLRGQPKRPFVYRHRGDLVSLGTADGVGEIVGLTLSGLPAWLLWRSIFLAKLPGWKNRVRVALDWMIGCLFERDLAKLEW